MKIFRIISVLFFVVFFANVIHAAKTDFISPEEVAKAHSMTYTKAQLDHFAKTMPSEKTQQWLSENDYVLMPGPPKSMSLLAIHQLAPKLFLPEVLEYAWYKSDVQRFSREETVKPTWLAIKKTLFFSSTHKTWDEQKKLLLDGERVPSVAEVAWIVTTYYKVRGVYMFPNFYVRTSSEPGQGTNKTNVIVGQFDLHGLDILITGNHFKHSVLGLSVVREY